MLERAYTWALVTYAKPEEYAPLLAVAKHWALCHHDKDWVIDDQGAVSPKIPHTHIICTFDFNVSIKWIRSHILGDQNTLGQRGHKEDSIAGLWRYLIHEGEDETQKHLYDESDRKCDNPTYWAQRIKDESIKSASDESFIEDLISDDYSAFEMGKKYGRDFIKNFERYEAFRRRVRTEQGYRVSACSIEGLFERLIEMNIPAERVYGQLYEIYADAQGMTTARYISQRRNTHEGQSKV